MVLLFVVLVGGWKLFGARLIKHGIEQGGAQVAGSQVDVDALSIHFFPPSVEIRGFAIADAADLMRNRLAVGQALVEVELLPLLQQKVIVRRVTVADVQTGSARAIAARPVKQDTTGAFAEVREFAQKVKVPVMSLVPIDSLKSVILNPDQLKAVQAAVALDHQADSVKQAVDKHYAALNLQPVIDSSQALVARLQDANVRTLGLDGARKALADVRRASLRVDSAKNRVDRLVSDVRKGSDSLQALVRGIDDARRDDYAMARGLLKLPSFDAPEIGAAIFGGETMQRFQKAMYYATLARKYAPAGLAVRETPGPTRRRRAGITVHFVTQESYPRFLLRRMDANLVGVGDNAVNYAIAASDLTTDPAITGKPMLFVARRNAKAGADSARITGSLDHTKALSRDVVSAYVSGVKLPSMVVPMLPFNLDPGVGVAETRFVLEGDRVNGSWTVRSSNLTWRPDSARKKTLNAMESIVAQAMTGIKDLQLTTQISGPIAAPRLQVQSNLDRVIAERMRAVAGEKIAAAQAKIKADVDRMVDAKLEPVKAKIAQTRADAEKKLADAKTKLDEEKKRLEEKVKSLAGGLPRIPGSD